MVLIKLRLNVPNQDLAYRFEISLSTVSRVFNAWMEVLDVRQSPLISWPEREELWRTMPRCFQHSFGKTTTIIIDCFDQFASCQKAGVGVYSVKEGNNCCPMVDRLIRVYCALINLCPSVVPFD